MQVNGRVRVLGLGSLVALGSLRDGPAERIIEAGMRRRWSHAPFAVDLPVDAAHLLLFDLHNGPELLELLLALARASAVDGLLRTAELMLVARHLPVRVLLADGSGACLHGRDG